MIRLSMSLLVLLVTTRVTMMYSGWSSLVDASSESIYLMVTLTVGLVMIGGWIAGLLAERVKLPAISGYLIFGVLIGPSLASLLGWGAMVPESLIHASPTGEASPMKFVNNLSISLIALIAGGEIQLNWLKGRLRQMVSLLLIYVFTAMTIMVIVMVVGRQWVPFLAEMDWPTAAVIASLASVVLVASSPAVTIAMISDYRADGPLSQTTLTITIFKDLLLVILFAIAMAVSQAVVNPEGELSGAFLIVIMIDLLGSIVLGALLGGVMAWYVGRIGDHLYVFIIGACLLIALLGEQKISIGIGKVHLEPLLMALSAGLLLRNFAPTRSKPLFHTIETMSLPVYCLFFTLAGATVDLEVFSTLWPIALGGVLVRTIAVKTGVKLAMWSTGLSGEPWASRFWLGMVSQAGVSLVFIMLIAEGFEGHPWTGTMKACVVGVIFVNQMVGPIGFRYALQRCGEIGQAR